MSLQGSLRDFSLADIFQLIGLQKKTGILVLRDDIDEIKILFDRGMIVGADSKLKKIEDRIGMVLVRSGKITRELLDNALEIQRETLQQLGYVLIENDMITMPELKEALQKQILQIIYRLFRWKSGNYEFHTKNAVDYNKDFIDPTPSEKILMEGIRMVDEWPLIEQVIPSYDIVFKKTPLEKDNLDKASEPFIEETEEDEDDLLFGFERPKTDSRLLNLEPNQSKIYDIIDGSKSVNGIIEISPYNEFETCKAIVELEKLYLIEKSDLIIEDEFEEIIKPKTRRATISISFKSLFPILVYMLITVAISLFFISSNMNIINAFSFNANIKGLSDTAIEIRFSQITSALRLFYLINNTYPDNIEDLIIEGFISRDILYDNGKAVFDYSREGVLYNLKRSQN